MYLSATILLAAQNVIFTNPSPEVSDSFGSSVAAVGTGRILIGARGDRDNSGSRIGKAYLFDLAGPLQTVLTNPPPYREGESFGQSVAAVGNDLMLIGAPYHAGFTLGAAYLFNSAGLLLTTITNPIFANDEHSFGGAVGAVGTNRLVIGAPIRDVGTTRYAGVAYIYDLAGVRLTTLTNPTPEFDDNFGSAVTGVGSDRVLIGARWDNTGAPNAGAAYLFDLAGHLITTITNPAPAANDYFGSSVAAVGANRLLIGAPGHATNTGAAYLFDLQGHLLTTFANPAASTNPFGDRFGGALAGVGPDRVVIGADGSTLGGLSVGAAYLFDLTGNLLRTMTSPTPDVAENFGVSVAGRGTDSVIIGASGARIGTIQGGAAYLISIGPHEPLLRIHRAGDGLEIDWPWTGTDFDLEEAASLTSNPGTTVWTPVRSPYQTNATRVSVAVPRMYQTRYYRLQQRAIQARLLGQ